MARATSPDPHANGRVTAPPRAPRLPPRARARWWARSGPRRARSSGQMPVRPPGDMPRRSGSSTTSSRRGRPRSSSGTIPAEATACSRESACRGARSTRSTNDGDSVCTASAAATTRPMVSRRGRRRSAVRPAGPRHRRSPPTPSRRASATPRRPRPREPALRGPTGRRRRCVLAASTASTTSGQVEQRRKDVGGHAPHGIFHAAVRRHRPALWCTMPGREEPSEERDPELEVSALTAAGAHQSDTNASREVGETGLAATLPPTDRAKRWARPPRSSQNHVTAQISDPSLRVAQPDPRSDVSHEALENLLHEDRALPAVRGVRRAGERHRGALRRGRGRPARLLGASRPRSCDWATPFDEVLDWSNAPFAKWFVGGQAQRRRTTASTGTSRPATATRSRSTGRASPATPATLTYAELQRRGVRRRPTR